MLKDSVAGTLRKLLWKSSVLSRFILSLVVEAVVSQVGFIMSPSQQSLFGSGHLSLHPVCILNSESGAASFSFDFNKIDAEFAYIIVLEINCVDGSDNFPEALREMIVLEES